jgi:hypothetical protein
MALQGVGGGGRVQHAQVVALGSWGRAMCVGALRGGNENEKGPISDISYLQGNLPLLLLG